MSFSYRQQPLWCLPVSVVVAVCLLPVSLWSQDDLPKDRQATVAFDFQVSRMLEEAEGLGVDTKVFKDVALPQFEMIAMDDIDRVYGAVSLPPSIQAFMAFGPQTAPPVDVFVRIRFKTVDAAEAMWDHLSRTGKEMEIDGARYLVENPDNPDSSLAQKTDSREIEVGTGSYIKRGDRKVRSDALIDAWNQAPNAAARIVIDMAGNSDLIDELMATARQEAPPMAAPFVGLLDNAKHLIVSSDPKNNNMLKLTAEGVDQENAEELKEGLNSLLEIGKMAAAQQLSNPPPGMESTATAMQRFVKSLKATQEGAMVTMAIDADKDMFQAISEGVVQAQAAARRAQRQNNVRQMLLAALNYESAYRRLPFTAAEKNDPALSWRVRVLPFIEQNNMYDQMDITKGPNEEPNAQFADQMPEVYGDDGKLANVVWVQSQVDRFAMITDGTSNTIALVETTKGMPWLENNSMPQAAVIEMIKGLPDGKTITVGFYDGSVHTMDNSIDKDTLRKLLNPRDGEAVDRDW